MPVPSSNRRSRSPALIALALLALASGLSALGPGSRGGAVHAGSFAIGIELAGAPGEASTGHGLAEARLGRIDPHLGADASDPAPGSDGLGRGPDGPGRGSDGLGPWDPRPALPFIAGERVGLRLIANDSGAPYRVVPGTDRSRRRFVRSRTPLRSRANVLRRRYLSYGPALAAVRAGASSFHSTTVPPPRI